MAAFSRFRKTIAMLAGSSIGTISTLSLVNATPVSFCRQPVITEPPNQEYSLNDVSAHNSIENRIWITFQDGVYDMTEFLPKHVGGPKYIELIAGGRLEPFWNTFNFHLKDKDTLQLLENYRIGNLSPSDQIDRNTSWSQFEFEYEPMDERSYDQWIVMRDRPLLSEAKNELLGDSFITPNHLFYIRNHYPVPYTLNEDNYRLNIHINKGVDMQFMQMNDEWDDIECDASLSLNDIMNRFQHIELTATLQCSGNRGYGLRKASGLKHTLCENGFISNAQWKGVCIRDVLMDCGYHENHAKFEKFKYVTFYGYDTDLSTLHYAMSVPIDHVMNKANDCLLVFEMNGKALPKDHGFPLRVLLPGIAGCRSVKWLAKIQLTEEEVQSPWQSVSYQPYKYKIYDMPVTSVITRPMDGDKLEINIDDNTVNIKGFAWSGGGRGIIRVEVSVDDGNKWSVAELQQLEQSKAWCWTLWNVNIDMKDFQMDNNGKCKVVCRAMDSAFNSQPKHVKDVVNGTMYVNNSWHTMNVQV